MYWGPCPNGIWAHAQMGLMCAPAMQKRTTRGKHTATNVTRNGVPKKAYLGQNPESTGPEKPCESQAAWTLLESRPANKQKKLLRAAQEQFPLSFRPDLNNEAAYSLSGLLV